MRQYEYVTTSFEKNVHLIFITLNNYTTYFGEAHEKLMASRAGTAAFTARCWLPIRGKLMPPPFLPPYPAKDCSCNAVYSENAKRYKLYKLQIRNDVNNWTLFLNV